MYMECMMFISNDVHYVSSYTIAKMANFHVPDNPMLPFPQMTSL